MFKRQTTNKELTYKGLTTEAGLAVHKSKSKPQLC